MLSKIEVLADLEEVVADLMAAHEAKRVLWFPSELLAPPPDTDPEQRAKILIALLQMGACGAKDLAAGPWH